MNKVLSLAFDIGMAIGPIMGYVYQYRLIHRTKTVGSFSIDICGILLLANILRLNFYLFKRFETALVFQSLFMIAMQIGLLQLCTRYQRKKVQADMAPTEENQLGNAPAYRQVEEQQSFWRWKKFSSFAKHIFIFTVVTFSISIVMHYFLDLSLFGELVGLLALTSESVLIAPQILKNYKMKTTRGLSYMLVFLNLFGDILKLVYFLINHQPFQFILCGVIQVCLDSFVVGQIFHYQALRKKQLKKDAKKQKDPIKILRQKFEEERGYKKDDRLSSSINLTIPHKQQLQSYSEESVTHFSNKFEAKIEDLDRVEVLKDDEESKNLEQNQSGRDESPQNVEEIESDKSSSQSDQSDKENRPAESQDRFSFRKQSENAFVEQQ